MILRKKKKGSEKKKNKEKHTCCHSQELHQWIKVEVPNKYNAPWTPECVIFKANSKRKKETS